MHSLQQLVLQNNIAILQKELSPNDPKSANFIQSHPNVVFRCSVLFQCTVLRSVRTKCRTAAMLPFWAASQMFAPRDDQPGRQAGPDVITLTAFHWGAYLQK